MGHQSSCMPPRRCRRTSHPRLLPRRCLAISSRHVGQATHPPALALQQAAHAWRAAEGAQPKTLHPPCSRCGDVAGAAHRPHVNAGGVECAHGGGAGWSALLTVSLHAWHACVHACTCMHATTRRGCMRGCPTPKSNALNHAAWIAMQRPSGGCRSLVIIIRWTGRRGPGWRNPSPSWA